MEFNQERTGNGVSDFNDVASIPTGCSTVESDGVVSGASGVAKYRCGVVADHVCAARHDISSVVPLDGGGGGGSGDGPTNANGGAGADGGIMITYLSNVAARSFGQVIG